MAADTKIRIGTCSWTDPTLVKSDVVLSRGEDDRRRAARVLRGPFPIVEVDATYYAPPSEKTSGCGWSEPRPISSSTSRRSGC